MARIKEKVVTFDADPSKAKEESVTFHHSTESNAAKKESSSVETEDIDMEPVEVIGDENESGKFPIIFDLF